MSALSGTRTLAVCETISIADHMALLESNLGEPARLHQLRETKIKEITAYQRSEWQMASDDLEVEKARLFLRINETPSDNGAAAAAAEALRVATRDLDQVKEKLEAERSRLILAVNDEVDEKSKPKYGSADLRAARLAVLQSVDEPYKTAAAAVREAEEKASKAKADADVQAPKPKYSNEAARKEALVLLQREDPDYKAALAKFRRADQRLAELKAEADDYQQQIANVSAKLWGLREMVKGDAAVLLAVASLDAPKLPAEVRLQVYGMLSEVRMTAPDHMPAVPLQAPAEPLEVTVNVARGAA